MHAVNKVSFIGLFQASASV